MIITKELKQAHEKVKAHPFRLNHNKDLEGFLKLLNNMSDEFLDVFEDEKNTPTKSFLSGWGYFYHELKSAIFHIEFEFKLRATLESYKNKFSEKEQKQVIIVIENYIQQIHKFIITGIFEEFITYYYGCNIKKGVSRWSKYKLNKEKNIFEFVGKLN